MIVKRKNNKIQTVWQSPQNWQMSHLLKVISPIDFSDTNTLVPALFFSPAGLNLKNFRHSHNAPD